ncbi:hypothetical protein H7J88_26745 [Mycolicibacterium flavescens]|uniref:PE domain-containing protein n=1 Tax=Mycolicibacterium flavescens TaxID=1776 RepID=A0A1E3RPQ9_MYCFV|nr:hypothetical protein [Mycolicibacterium flavescens]MCV7283240.1 hypothetical protein [Mycolicibacterium flavescens]ODQ91840.1 hypothetical protein BHQ18_02980 [Mycolicibacterium flavescens]
MSDAFLAAPAGMSAFSAASQAASTAIVAAGTADNAAVVNAVAVALGPIGAAFLAAYGPAQANNLADTLLVGGVHAGVSAATDSAKSAIVAADNG